MWGSMRMCENCRRAALAERVPEVGRPMPSGAATYLNIDRPAGLTSRAGWNPASGKTSTDSS
jgi:hypothetical protein